MNLPRAHYRNLFGVYLWPQRATGAPPQRLLMLAVQVGATNLSELIGWIATKRLASPSIMSACRWRSGRCVACSAGSPAVRGDTRRLSCALFTH
jgi:hypothetical protein